jgi:pimeloyl-ACP methyl ester carboxylesterase
VAVKNQSVRLEKKQSLAAFLFAAACALVAVNRTLVARETKPASADGGTLLELPGGAIHVQDEGPRDASVLLLIHGLAGSLRWFDRLVPALASEHRVIRVDLLGHGGSEKPAGGYAIGEQARLLASALDRLGIRPALVVGHALGGAVAVALAELDPSLVPRLVVVDEGPDNTFGRFPLLARLGLQPVLGELLHSLVSDGMVRDGYSDAFGDGFDLGSGFDDPDQVVRDFRRMTFSSYKSSTLEEQAYLEATRLDGRVRMLGLPVLAIFGEQDRFFRAHESAQAYRMLPNARVELLAGCGHSPNVERPTALAPLILAFAADSKSGPG